MPKPETLGNQLTKINFIGEELQAFTKGFIKLGVLSKEDLKGIIQDVNERVVSLSKVANELREDHLI